MAAKDVPPIDLIEEEEEEWPEAGAQNLEEAEQYMDKINNIFDHLSTLIHDDKKDALGQTIKNFKKLVAKQWETMGDADVDVILRTIKDPAAVYLCQHLTRGRVKVFDPPEEIPTGLEFIRQLPERTRHAEEMAFISDIFHHAAQAHEHLSEVCANISALAKVTDKTTLLAIINGAVRPLVQLNIPEGFLNLMEDRWAKTTEEERWEKVRKMVSTHPKCTLPGPQTKERPHPHISSGSLAEDEQKVFQWGDSQGSMWEIWHKSQAVVPSVDGEEVPWWYSS